MVMLIVCVFGASMGVMSILAVLSSNYQKLSIIYHGSMHLVIQGAGVALGVGGWAIGLPAQALVNAIRNNNNNNNRGGGNNQG